MKKPMTITAIVMAFLIITGFVFWRLYRNPYEDRYFSAGMRMKYPTVESVLSVMSEGRKCDTDSRIELMNEAYGFNLIKRYGRREPQSAAMGSVKEIKYYKSKKLAVVNLEPTNPGSTGPAWWFVWRKGRWVFYPESPWLSLLEFIHGI